MEFLSLAEKVLVEAIGRERLEKNALATVNYNRLMNSFSRNLSGTEYDFPDYYGGAYIDQNNNLVLNVIGDLERCKNAISLRIDDSSVQYKPVSVSYNELRGIINSVVKFKKENPSDDLAANISAWGIDQTTNKVRIYLKNPTSTKMLSFKEKISASNAVQFLTARGLTVDDATIYAGNPIDNGTAGYRAKKGSKEGMVTAGHVVSLNSFMKTTGNTSFALCSARQYEGTVDAAFCELTNLSYSFSNTIYDLQATLSTSVFNPSVGSTVFKVGQTTGLTTGVVKDTDFGYTINNVTFNNLTATDYEADSGDSGGIVYYMSGSIRYTAGIHKGRSSGYSAYCKAAQINSALGLTRY